jgi:small neutral amino acid transporter SnatA (MarC family)
VDFKPLVTLQAIVNPLACVPFFIHYTQGFGPAQRRRTVWIASITVLVVSGASALLGQTGIDVMTRLMGLILAAPAVEVMADGLQSLFPALGASPRR